MRVLRVHGPGADLRVADAIGAAVAAFNGALDIRLRFLAIGIEETVLDASATSPDGTAAAARALREAPYEAVVLLGDPEAAHTLSTAAKDVGVPVVRVGAGHRKGRTADAARAADRLALAHVALDAASAAVLREEGFSAPHDPPGDDPAAAGERVVRALTQVRRLKSC